MVGGPPCFILVEATLRIGKAILEMVQVVRFQLLEAAVPKELMSHDQFTIEDTRAMCSWPLLAKP